MEGPMVGMGSGGWGGGVVLWLEQRVWRTWGKMILSERTKILHGLQAVVRVPVFERVLEVIFKGNNYIKKIRAN